jgi:positive regulator of sigma E activity
MGAADILIFLIAVLGYLTAFIMLRRMRRRDKVNERVVRSLDTAIRYQRIE